MLKSVAPAWIIRLDLNDPFPRLQVVTKLTAKVGVLQLGPFIGRRNLDHSMRALSRLLGLRVCAGRLHARRGFFAVRLRSDGSVRGALQSERERGRLR